MTAEDFYDRMDDVMSPELLDPVRAMIDAITSLSEQIKTRVTSVENGRKYQAKQPGDASMPDGAAIFATTGAWEDYSTPARDFRLLIAIDVVKNFPDRFARRSDRYAMPAGKSVADDEGRIAGHAGLGTCFAQGDLYAQRRLSVDAIGQGCGRSGSQISRWPTTPTTAWSCDGARPRAAKRPRHASVMRRRRSAQRCRNTAPGSASGTGRRTVRIRALLIDSTLSRRTSMSQFWHVSDMAQCPAWVVMRFQSGHRPTNRWVS